MKKAMIISMLMTLSLQFLHCSDDEKKNDPDYSFLNTDLDSDTIPSNPSSLSSMATSPNSVRLTWTDTSDNEITFRIYRSLSSTAGFSEIGSVYANKAEYTDTGLSPLTTYYYRVTARNNNGESGHSDNNVKTPPENETVGISNAPSNFRIDSKSTTWIKLAWNDNSNNETGFKISIMQWNSELGIGILFAIPETTGANATTHTITGLTENTNYYFYLTAYNAEGSSATVIASAITESVPPPAVTGPATAVAGTQFTINWTFNNPSSPLTYPGDHYEIQYSYTNSSDFQLVGSTASGQLPLNNSSNITITDEGTYYFRIKAVYNSKYVYSNVLMITCDEAAVSSVDLEPSYDNLLLNSSEDVTLANTTFQSDNLAVGYNFVLNYMPDGNGGSIPYMTCMGAASLLKFHIPSDISGKTVQYAELRFWVLVLPADLNTTYKIAAVFSLWNPLFVYWNVRPDFYTDDQAEASPPIDPYQPVTFDVTAIVQAWADGVISNNGFILYDPNYMYPEDTAMRGTDFYSREASSAALRPHLYIEYQ